MKRNFFLSITVIILMLVSAAIFYSCTPASGGKGSSKTIDVFSNKNKSTSPVIATVGDSVVTKKDFEERLNRLNPYLRSRYKSLDQKKKLLAVMIKNEALAQEAMALNLHQDSKIIEQIKSELANAIIKTEFDGKMKDSLVTDDDINKYYKEHLDQYKRPETIRVSHIFLKKNEIAKAKKVYKLAKAQKNERRSFTKLAKEYSSDEASKNMGGDLSYMSSEEMTKSYGKAFADAAFKLKNTNDISPMVETEKGFHILKLRGKRQPIDRPLDKVKSSIKSRLYYSKRSEALDNWIEKIKTKVGVKVNEEVLKEITVPEAPKKTQAKPKPIGAEKAKKAADKMNKTKKVKEKKQEKK